MQEHDPRHANLSRFRAGAADRLGVKKDQVGDRPARSRERATTIFTPLRPDGEGVRRAAWPAGAQGTGGRR
jgi:hypothetical protein